MSYMTYRDSDPEDPRVFAYGCGDPRYTGPLTVKRSEFESHKKYWEAELYKRNIQGMISGIRSNLDELEKYLTPKDEKGDSGWVDSAQEPPAP